MWNIKAQTILGITGGSDSRMCHLFTSNNMGIITLGKRYLSSNVYQIALFYHILWEMRKICK